MADERRAGADGRMSELLRAFGLTGLEEEAALFSRLRLAQGRTEVESSESSSFSWTGLRGIDCLRRWPSSESGGVVRPKRPALNAGAAAAAADEVGWWRSVADEAERVLEGVVGRGRGCGRRSTGERTPESSSPSELTAVNGMPAGTWERCILAASLLDMGRMLESRMLPAPLRRIRTGFLRRA